MFLPKQDILGILVDRRSFRGPFDERYGEIACYGGGGAGSPWAEESPSFEERSAV